jgi:Trypsin-co-occurring domain 1
MTHAHVRSHDVTELAAFELADGGSVLVEVDAPDRVSRVGRRDDILRSVGRTFEETLATVRNAAAAALGQFQDMAHRPDEVEITFGVKLDAEVGAVVARTGVEGQLQVKLTWHAPADKTAAGVTPAE